MKVNVVVKDTDVDIAYAEIHGYFSRENIEKKGREFVKKLTDLGYDEAINALGHVDTGETLASIEKTVSGNTGRISAGGNAVWLEFGTGVAKNGAAGSSPHPLGVEHGMIIGQYGNGHGASPDGWWYPVDGNPDNHERSNWRHTYGIEANMFMYKTFRKMVEEIPTIAKEVFGK